MRLLPFLFFPRRLRWPPRFLGERRPRKRQVFPNDRGSPPSNAASRSFWDVPILKFLMPRQTIGFMHPCGPPIPVLACCNHYELWRERWSQYATVSTETKCSCVASRCLLLVNRRGERMKMRCFWQVDPLLFKNNNNNNKPTMC